MKEAFFDLKEEEKKRLIEILQELKHDAEALDKTGDYYFDSYYKNKAKIKKMISDINRCYFGFSLEFKEIECFGIRLDVIIDGAPCRIEDLKEAKAVRKAASFNCRAFLEGMLILPKSSLSPFSRSARWDRWD